MARVNISTTTTPTHTVPSGMGGIFNVILSPEIKAHDGEKTHQRVIVVHPYGDTDWHGVTFFEKADLIKPIDGVVAEDVPEITREGLVSFLVDSLGYSEYDLQDMTFDDLADGLDLETVSNFAS